MIRRSTRLAKTFGKRVRELREKHGLTQAELGERVHLEKSWVSRIENGEASIADGAFRASRFANALGVSLSDLLPRS